jgi:hypothetical protein
MERGGVDTTLHPNRFTSGRESRVTIEKEARWVPQLVCVPYLLHEAKSFLRSLTVNCVASQEIPRIYGTRVP